METVLKAVRTAAEQLETLLPAWFIGSVEFHIYKAGCSNATIKVSYKPKPGDVSV